MPTVAELRAADRRSYVMRYSGTGNSSFGATWWLPAVPTPAGSGAGVVPTTFSGSPDGLPSDGVIVDDFFDGGASPLRPFGRLFDLVWVGPSISASSAATTTLGSVTFPARDDNGTTDGTGYRLGLVGNVTPGGSPAYSWSYTNQAGTSGRTATLSAAAGNPPSTMLRYPDLEGTDTGVRSVESFTVTAAGSSGSVVPIIFRQLHTTQNRNGLVGTAAVSPPPPFRRSALSIVQEVKAGTLLLPAWYFAGSTTPTFVRHIVTVAYP